VMSVGSSSDRTPHDGAHPYGIKKRRSSGSTMPCFSAIAHNHYLVTLFVTAAPVLEY
jgi:hypothetical protein